VVTERRRLPRRRPAAGEPIARVRLRTGAELSVLDVSDTGALLTGGTRLLPGTRADVHVIGRSGRVLVRARIVRAYVSRLEADAIEYRIAVLFDTVVDTSPAGYSFPVERDCGAAAEGNAYPVAPGSAFERI
jgi:hypothetical protein